MTVLDNQNDKIDNEIELEVMRLKYKNNRFQILMKFGVMLLALTFAFTIALLFDGDYATYTFILVGIIVSYVMGDKDIRQLLTDKMKDMVE